MDRKSILVLVASFALLAGWFLLVPVIYPPIPRPLQTNAVPSAPAPLELDSRSNGVAPAPSPASPAAPAPTSLTGALPVSQVPEQIETVETAEALYVFSSHGGGLKRIELKKFREDVGRGARKTPASGNVMELNERADLPALALRGLEAQGDTGAFALAKPSAHTVQATQVLSNGLRVVKEFTVTSNYLLQARLRLENRSSAPVTLPDHSWSLGTASSVSSLDDPSLLGAFWYNGVKVESVASSWFENRSFCAAGVPRPLYTAGASNVQWAAVHNQFFTMALLPATNHWAASVLVRRVNLPPLPVVRGKTAPPHGYEASLVYGGSLLASGQALERDFSFYAGPKEYKTLSRLGRSVDVVMGYTGFFGWFAKALLLSMNGLYALVPNYGIVIILITIIIKLLFWPLTQASTRSMKRMQALQPQMKALQEKYKEDPAKMNRKLMEFMKENKVSPMGGCLPMLLQIPVFIGFYQMIRSAIELRGVRFLWAQDLSRPDTVAYLPGLDFPINPLPLIMGATMLWQARMTPVSPGMDPMQQKIMKYMPMIFMVFLYNFSAGLTLYWTVQNLLTIAQMKLTKMNPEAPRAPMSAPAALTPKKKKARQT